ELDKKLRAHAEELAKRLPRNQTVPANTEEQAPRPVEKQAPVASAAAQPERTEPAKPRKPESSAKVQEELHYGPVLPATPAPQLDEALLRLELTRLVKEYFDNIDKRISKLEPPGEGTIAPPVTRRSLEEPISPEEMEELQSWPANFTLTAVRRLPTGAPQHPRPLLRRCQWRLNRANRLLWNLRLKEIQLLLRQPRSSNLLPP